MNELRDSLQEQGKINDMEAIARDSFAREKSPQSLASLIHVLLNQGKAAEADRILDERISADAASPDQLAQIGRLAQSLERDEVAEHAAHALEKLGGGPALTGTLLDSSVLIRSGDSARGISLLRVSAKANNNDPAVLGTLANAMDAAGDDADAIDALKRSNQIRPDELVLERLCGILDSQNRSTEAIPYLQTLRRSASNSSLRNLAIQKLVASARSDGTIDSLIDRAKDSLASGAGDESDIDFLVDAYVGAKKPMDAADVLKTAKCLAPIDRLKKLVILYLRSGKPDLAEGVLRQLADADPPRAIDTLVQLASVELELKRPQAAMAVVAEIHRRLGDESEASNGVLADVLERLGRPAEAADYYRRQISAKPDGSEVWLLWAAAVSKSGHQDVAVQTLEHLSGNAQNENLMATAVDGLLNVKAPAFALLKVRRDVILRLASDPGRIVPYHLICDLSTELSDVPFNERTTEASVAVGSEERPSRLRELMESAIDHGRVDEAAAYGRSMLALGNDFPPELFLDLGEQMLLSDRPQEARRAFDRAAEVSSDEFALPRAAALLENYGYPDLAFTVVSPLAARNHYDRQISLCIAHLDEVTGRRSEAFRQYRSVLRADLKPFATGFGSVPFTDSDSPFSDSIAFRRLLVGVLSTSDSSAEQSQILDELRPLERQVIRSMQSPGQQAQKGMQTLGILRGTYLSMHRLDAFDRLEAELVQHPPVNRPADATAMSALETYGFFDAIERSRRSNVAAAVTTAPAVASGNANDVALILPMLVARGELDEAARRLAGVRPAAPGVSDRAIATMIATALALNDQKRANQWAAVWIDTAVFDHRDRSDPLVAVSRAWPILDNESRLAFANKLIAADAGDAANPLYVGTRINAMRIGAEMNLDVPGRFDTAVRLVKEPLRFTNLLLPNSFGPASLIRLLAVPERAKFFASAIRDTAPPMRLAFIVRLVSQSDAPFDPATDDAIIASLKSLDPGQMQALGGWVPGKSHPALMAALGEAIFRATRPDQDFGPLVSTAIALRQCSSPHAEAVALMAIDQARRPILASPGDSDRNPRAAYVDSRIDAMLLRPSGRMGAFHAGELFRKAVTVLSDDSRNTLLKDLANHGPDAGETVLDRAWRSVMTGIVLESVGRPDEALASLREGYKLAPVNREILLVYAARLDADGRYAEILEQFYHRRPIEDEVLRTMVNRALERLCRSREIQWVDPGVGASVAIRTPNVDFVVPGLADNKPELAENLRIVLTWWRENPFNSFSFHDLPDQGLSPARQLSAFDGISGWPGSIQDLVSNWDCAEPGSPYSKWICDRLCQAADESPAGLSQRESLLKNLQARATAGEVGANDRLLLSKLAMIKGIKLSDPLVKELWNLPFDGKDHNDFEGLQRCLSAQGCSDATHVQRWSAAWEKVNPATEAPLVGDLASLPSPLARTEDSSLAAIIGAELDRSGWAVAKSHLGRLRDLGRVSTTYVQCRMVSARIAAEEGDIPAFRACLEEGIESKIWSTSSASDPIATELFLPGNPVGSARADLIARTAVGLLEELADRYRGQATFTREIVSAGQWANRNGAVAAAKDILSVAGRVADREPGTGQLWLADFAQELGDTDLHTQTELKLLKNDRLPEPRMIPLLAGLRLSGRAGEAAALASEAGRYCLDPRLKK